MMADLLIVDIASIDANPFRALDKYPYVERKIEALKHSIAGVGLWEGIIARRNGNRFEIAFGHHRLKAARDSGLLQLSLIVRELSDAEMLQFMGRENLEDYNADFLCMLETWEAAVLFRTHAFENQQPIEIARFLGWTRVHDNDEERMNHTALACNAALPLIRGGYLTRDDLRDYSVRNVEIIAQRTLSRMEQIDDLAKQTRRPTADVEDAKQHLADAAKETIRESRAGRIAGNDLRGTLDINAHRRARESGRPNPLFEVFGKDLANSIARMLNGDAAAVKLEEVRKALGDVTLDDDKRVIARLDFELGELGERAVIWRKRITPTEKKVANLQIAKREE